jgi:predicted transcriptional regulator
MTIKLRTIEVDSATAEALDARAASRGMSVGELIAELVGRDEAPLAVDGDQIAELDRRWATAKSEKTIGHDEVVRWLEAWGTPAFKPWREQ